MKEQSHKEEMSAALRGDFQRLRERGVSAALVPQDTPEPDETPSGDEPAAEPRAVIDVEPVSEPQPEPSAEPPAEPLAAPPAEQADEVASPRRSWLSRLAGR